MKTDATEIRYDCDSSQFAVLVDGELVALVPSYAAGDIVLQRHRVAQRTGCCQTTGIAESNERSQPCNEVETRGRS